MLLCWWRAPLLLGVYPLLVVVVLPLLACTSTLQLSAAPVELTHQMGRSDSPSAPPAPPAPAAPHAPAPAGSLTAAMPLQIIRLSGSVANVDLPGRRAGLLHTAVSSCRPQLVAALVALAQEEVEGRGVGLHLLPDEPGDSDEGSDGEEDGSGGEHRSPAAAAAAAAEAVVGQTASAGSDVARYLQGLTDSGQRLLHHMAASEVLLGRGVSVRVSKVVPQAEQVRLSLVGGRWVGGLEVGQAAADGAGALRAAPDADADADEGLCRPSPHCFQESRQRPGVGLPGSLALAGSAGA